MTCWCLIKRERNLSFPFASPRGSQFVKCVPDKRGGVRSFAASARCAAGKRAGRLPLGCSRFSCRYPKSPAQGSFGLSGSALSKVINAKTPRTQPQLACRAPCPASLRFSSSRSRRCKLIDDGSRRELTKDCSQFFEPRSKQTRPRAPAARLACRHNADYPRRLPSGSGMNRGGRIC